MAEQKVEQAALMMDFLLGQMEAAEAKSFQERIEKEAPLQDLQKDVANTLKALTLLPAAEPPADLAERTIARIRQDKQLKTLLAHQEGVRRPAGPMFSLREVGAIAAAFILMAVILVPSIRQAHYTSLRTECAANMGEIGTAMGTYAIEHQNQLPSVESNYRRWLTCENRPFASNSTALFQLISKPYLSPTRMQCPAVGGGSFVVQAGMTNFPSDEYVSYSYQHAVGRALRQNDATLKGKESQMAILADKTPIFPDGVFHPERLNAQVSDNHDKTGQNVLYMDYHVAWADNANVGVNGDNIYLVNGVTNYVGDETPTEATDSFLLPAYTRPCTIQP